MCDKKPKVYSLLANVCSVPSSVRIGSELSYRIFLLLPVLICQEKYMHMADGATPTTGTVSAAFTESAGRRPM